MKTPVQTGGQCPVERRMTWCGDVVRSRARRKMQARLQSRAGGSVRAGEGKEEDERHRAEGAMRHERPDTGACDDTAHSEGREAECTRKAKWIIDGRAVCLRHAQERSFAVLRRIDGVARLLRDVIGRDLVKRRRSGMYQDQMDDLWKVVETLESAMPKPVEKADTERKAGG